MKKLIMMIGLASIVSCSTVPEFPPINCKPITIIPERELEAIICETDCKLPRTVLKKIFDNYQKKSECLEEYQSAAGSFK